MRNRLCQARTFSCIWYEMAADIRHAFYSFILIHQSSNPNNRSHKSSNHTISCFICRINPLHYKNVTSLNIGKHNNYNYTVKQGSWGIILNLVKMPHAGVQAGDDGRTCFSWTKIITLDIDNYLDTRWNDINNPLMICVIMHSIDLYCKASENF